VKLGDFTALTLPTEGGLVHRKGSQRERAFGPTRPSDRSLLAADAHQDLVDPMGHERTGEAHDQNARSYR